MKKNGFSCPLHWQQVLTWILFSLNLCTFYIFTQCLLVNEDKKALIVIYGILTGLVLLVGVIATCIDPSDMYFKSELKKRRKIEKENGKYVLEIAKNLDFCVICASNVDSTSKHCKMCDRCVNNFDHHCNWLNNCIGDQNYSYFITLLIVVLIDCSYTIGILFYSFSIFINRTKHQNEKMQNLANELNITPVTCAIVSFIMGFINFCVIVNIIYLLILHTYLRCYKGLTTYDYIIKKLEKIENAEKEKEEANDNSESIVLRIDKKRSSVRKGRNKLIPDDLLNKIKNIEKKIDFTENNDKIVINEVDYNCQIFKPVIDEIYLHNTINKETNRTTPEINANNNYIAAPDMRVKSDRNKMDNMVRKSTLKTLSDQT